MSASEGRSGVRERWHFRGLPRTSREHRKPGKARGRRLVHTPRRLMRDGQLEITMREMRGRHVADMRTFRPYSGEGGLPVTRR